MAWDDTPPSPQELASAPAWDATPPKPEELDPNANHFTAGNPATDDLPIQDATVSDFGMLQGAGDLVKLGVKGIGLLAAKEAPEVAANVAPKVAETVANGVPKAAETGAQDLPKGAPTPGAPPTPDADDPLKELKDYITGKYGAAAQKPGFVDTVAEYLRRESQNMMAKDLGIQARMGYKLGPGFEGANAVRAIAQGAMDEGLNKPTLGTLGREKLIVERAAEAAKQIEASRSLADLRGSKPSLDAIKQAVKDSLMKKYGPGVNAAPNEIQAVMTELNNADPTHKGLAELATKLNKATTPAKDLGQNPGPMTDAANIISQLNNKAIKGTLNPAEADAYDTALKKFGLYKQLDNIVGRTDIKEATGRTNQRGIISEGLQKLLDRGGYRLLSGALNKASGKLLSNPGSAKTLPGLFSTLGDAAAEVWKEIEPF